MNKSVSSLLTVTLMALCVLTGCRETVQTGRSAVPVVGDIVSSAGDGRALSLLESFNEKDSKGVISIIGPSETVSAMASRFLTSDDFDNIDGRRVPDQLPDFAGETISFIADDCNTPYDRYLQAGDADGLRSLTVNHLISALDTLASFSISDNELLARKEAAKVVVFASPFMAENGYFDVDTLLTIVGKNVPVVFPVLEVFEDEYSRHDRRFAVAVMSDSVSVTNGVYGRIFASMGREKGTVANECRQFAADTCGNVLVNLLDSYINAGGMSSLSAVIIDSPAVGYRQAEEALAEILGGEGERNASYRELLAEDFRIIDVYKAATDRCYSIMRKNNSFTHNIAYPQLKAYLTAKPASGEGYRIVETDKYVQDNY